MLYYQCQIYDVKFTILQNTLMLAISHIFLNWKVDMSNRLGMSPIQCASLLLCTLFTRRRTIKNFSHLLGQKKHIFLGCYHSHTLNMLRFFQLVTLLSFCCYLLIIFTIFVLNINSPITTFVINKFLVPIVTSKRLKVSPFCFS